jgi:acetyltransferase-like isoleucine patch superfamily enzyme
MTWEKTIKQETITEEEARKVIEKDNESFDWLAAHKGFFAPELPFSKPIHVGSIIIWPPADIHPNAQIGEGTVIGRFTNITGPVKIGAKCRIQGFNFIPSGVELGDNCFIGPHACFTNMRYPSVYGFNKQYERTVIGDRVIIGAGAIILPVNICDDAFIGAGAVVTKDIVSRETVIGIPAERRTV